MFNYYKISFSLKFIIFLIFLLGFYNAINLGASWDEPFHHILGMERLNYLLSFGKFKNDTFSVSQFYPGFYDTFSALIYFLVEKINFDFAQNYLFEIKHLINFSFSTTSLIGLYKVLKLYSKNKNFSLLVCLITFLNPFFFGHLSFNPKDMIIFFSLIWFIYFFSIYILYKNTLKYLILFSFFFGFGCGIRLSFLILPLPIIFIGIVYYCKKFNLSFVCFLKNNTFRILISISIIFFFTLIAWSHLHNFNFDVIKNIFLNSIKWSAGPKLGLINGTIYETFNTPKTYFISFLMYKMPIYQSIIFFCSIFIIFLKRNFLKKKIKNFVVISNFSIFFLFYIIFLVLILNVKIYDGIRLFLFLIPFFSIISAFFIYYIIFNFNKNINKLYAGIIFIFFIFFFIKFISLNPYQYSYLNLNPTIDTKGFENDYWNASFKELIQKIPDKINGTKTSDFNFFICGGDKRVAYYYLFKKFNKINITNFESADLAIMTNRTSFNLNDRKTCFQKYLGDELVIVQRNNMQLSKLIKIIK